MLKTVGAIAGGVFVGALVMEIVRTKCPDTLDKFYAKLGSLSTAIKGGFLEGYRSTAKASESAEVTA